MVTEDYVSRETYKLLKEKGYNGAFRTCYSLEGYTYQALHIYDAMKWLREEHELFIDITAAMEDYIEDGVVKYKDPYYTWEVFSLEIGETLCFGEAQNVKKSYEAACEVAIKYCLKNLI